MQVLAYILNLNRSSAAPLKYDTLQWTIVVVRTLATVIIQSKYHEEIAVIPTSMHTLKTIRRSNVYRVYGFFSLSNRRANFLFSLCQLANRFSHGVPGG